MGLNLLLTFIFVLHPADYQPVVNHNIKMVNTSETLSLRCLVSFTSYVFSKLFVFEKRTKDLGKNSMEAEMNLKFENVTQLKEGQPP